MSNKSKRKTLLEIVSSDNLERSLTVAINGVRYEYYFHGEVPYVAAKRMALLSSGRTIQWLNRQAWKVERITPKEVP